MNSLFKITIASILFGLGLGAAVAYIEVSLWTSTSNRAKQPAGEAPSSENLQPRAEVPELTYKFGNIERGTTMSHVFKVRNAGAGRLTVEVASTTCKCTVGDLSKNEIGPNEEAEVLLEWTAKTAAGLFRHGATLTTNDPQHSLIELTVEGEVVESSSLSPSEMYFGTVHAGESKEMEIYLASNLDEEVQILNTEISDEQLASELTFEITPAEKSELPFPESTNGLKISATYQAGNRIGPFRGWLELTTNLSKAKKLSVAIGGTVVGDISVFGPGWSASQGLLRMGSFTSAEGKKVKLNLTIRGEHAESTEFEVQRVDPPELRASLGEKRVMSDKLVHVPLIIEVAQGTRPLVRIGEPASSDATVLLKTNHPDADEILLRVHFSVEP